MSSKRRGLEATRRIMFEGDASRAVDFLDAANLEQTEEKRGQRLLEIAEHLAHAEDAEAQIGEIVNEFFAHPPRSEDEPDPTGIDVDEGFDPMKHPNGRVPAHSPTDPLDANKPEDVRAGRPGRTVDEATRACNLLSLAVRMNADLKESVKKAGMKALSVAPKKKTDHHARVSMLTAVERLARSIEEAGVMPTAKGIEQDNVAMQAHQAGIDPDRVMHFSKEWDALRERNMTTMTKDDYVHSNLKRDSQ